MDISEGHQELSVALAETIAVRFDASADWLLTGCGRPFPVRSLGDNYHDFFLPQEDMTGWRFELMRICGGRHDATLLCLRQSPDGHFSLGAVSAEFVLGDGMGGTGRGKLQDFLIFLKHRVHHCVSTPMSLRMVRDWKAAGTPPGNIIRSGSSASYAVPRLAG